MIEVSLHKAKEYVLDVMQCGLVPYIRSSPGMGKSSIVKEIATENSLKLIDLRLSYCEPTDLNGFPRISDKTNKASYIPFDTFPLETDPLPKGYDGWLLFLDELSLADKQVQKAAYKLILDKEIGDKKLHSNVVIVCAGNLITDNALVEELSSALQSRMVHINVRSDLDVFIKWASQNNVSHMITAFLKFEPMYLFKFDPNHDDCTFACQRTWEFADKLLKHKGLGSPDLLPLLAGTISEGVARAFLHYTNCYRDLPSYEEIVKDPNNARIPSNPGSLFAVCSCLESYATQDNIKDIIQYVMRLPSEFQVVCLTGILARTKTTNITTKNPHIINWVLKKGTLLFD